MSAAGDPFAEKTVGVGERPWYSRGMFAPRRWTVLIVFLALAPASTRAAELQTFELPSALVDPSTPGGTLEHGRTVPKVHVLPVPGLGGRSLYKTIFGSADGAFAEGNSPQAPAVNYEHTRVYRGAAVRAAPAAGMPSDALTSATSATGFVSVATTSGSRS